MKSLKKLFWISRPLSWPNTSYPFFVGFLLTQSAVPSGLTVLTCIIGTLYFIGPYNLLMYGVNDVYDYESDIRNPRKGGVEGMKESKAFHPTILKAVAVTNIPFLAYLFIVSPWPARAVLGLVVAAALAYSLKGLRFKEIPVLDSITSSFHFVGPLLYALSLASFPAEAWPWVSAFFLWGMASHAFGAIQDIIPDRAAKLHSIATALGARTTAWVSVLLYAAASLVVLVTSHNILIALIGVLYIVNCAPYLTTTDATSEQTNRGWRRFLWLNYISGAVITFVILSSFFAL